MQDTITCQLNGEKIQREYRMEYVDYHGYRNLLPMPFLYDHEDVFHALNGDIIIVERYDPRKIK